MSEWKGTMECQDRPRRMRIQYQMTSHRTYEAEEEKPKSGSSRKRFSNFAKWGKRSNAHFCHFVLREKVLNVFVVECKCHTPL